MTDAYRFPFIAEFVYAVIEHARYRQKVLGLCEESVDEKYDLEAGSAKIFCDVV
jgi:hypothetical protein